MCISVNTEITDNSVAKLPWNLRRLPPKHAGGARRPAVLPRGHWGDWLPLGLLPAGAFSLRGIIPAWVFMWALAGAIFWGCKWLTWRRAARVGPRSGIFRALAYLLAWPGMDAAPFRPRGNLALRDKPVFLGGLPLPWAWLFAAAKTLLGALLVMLAARRTLNIGPLATGWLGMVGIVLFLHFGAFHLLALAWNRAGINVQPLMRSPLLAKSLGEFWSTRWNTAFNTLAYDLAFRPLARRLGVARATLSVFAISGIVHDAVISLPARGGYGLPAGYFLFQGLAVLLERSAWGRRAGLGRGLRGRLFALVCVAGPAFWLFHPSFVRNVILPMLKAIGAI